MTWLYEEQGNIDRFFKENYWYPASEAERRVLVLAAPHQGVPLGTLEEPGPVLMLEGEKKTGAEVEVLHPALVEARKDMLATGILEKYNEGYQVSDALFRIWLQKISVLGTGGISRDIAGYLPTLTTVSLWQW